MEQSGISARTVYGAVALFIALLAGLYLLYQVYEIVLALLLTLLFSVALSAPVDYLSRRGVPRTPGTLAVMAVLGGVIWLAGWILAPSVREQARQLAEEFPELLEQVAALIDQLQDFFGFEVAAPLEAENLANLAGEFLREHIWEIAGAGLTAATVISLGVVVLIAGIYLTARPQRWVNGFVSLFPAERRQEVREVLEKLYHTVQRWLVGQLVAMTFIGVSSAIALHILGIPFALLLGLFAGLVSFVPFLGAVVGAVPPLLLALASDPILAVWVVVVYTIIQQVESNVIQPVVMSRAVELHPALVLFAILLMGTLFGIIGVLLAVPVVAVVQVLVNELWVKRMDQRGTDPNPPRQHGSKGSLYDRITGTLKALRSRRPSGKRG